MNWLTNPFARAWRAKNEAKHPTYAVIDRQGMGTMAARRFSSLEEVRDALASFHSIDVEGTEKMTLIDLCEVGEWEITKNGKEIEL